MTRLKLTAFVAMLWVSHAHAQQNERELFFERRVRPLLISKCVDCHGADEQEGKLRLDSRAGLVRGGKSGAVVVAGKPDRSLLVKAVRRSGKLKMPPDEPLSKAEVATLTKWVKTGAYFPARAVSKDKAQRIQEAREKHWAYQPLRSPQVPSLSHSRIQSDVDRFVLQQLQSKGLALSPPAAKATLVRRAYYDLIGLPPSYQQAQQFIRDKSPRAFEQLIDRLLARKEYGQHWARHWLDVARYSDTTGYQEGAELRYPFAYTYRDYVVRSVNEDTPYDRFILEQMAADRLPLRKEQRWKLAALGFLTLGPRFNYNQHDVIDDRIDVVSRGLLGLTVSCSRCHDHKYDAILSADYYGFYGIFASSSEPWQSDLPVIGQATRKNPKRYKRFRAQLAKRDAALTQLTTTTHRKILHEMRAFAGEYLWYVVQQMPEHRTVTQVSYDTNRIHLRGPTPYGPGAVVRWQHEVQYRGRNDIVFGLWNQLARLNKRGFKAAAARLLQKEHPDANKAVLAALRNAAPASMLDVAQVYGNLLEGVYRRWVRLQKIDQDIAAFQNVTDEQLRQILYGPQSPVAMNIDEAREAYTDGEFNKYMALKRNLDRTLVEFGDVAAPRAMVLYDRAIPKEPRVFSRGNSTKPGAVAQRQFLRVLAHIDKGKPKATGSGRLSLAKAIVHPRNPLTARVIVNRVWGWHFGKALVRSPSDFGVRGSKPTHPELLDWLTHSFIRGGWSLKKLHKMIMLSATYQQGSLDHPQGLKVDPRNELIWRMNIRRLQFEELRDSLLLVAKRLDTRSGGRPTHEFDSPRRSLYMSVNRLELAEVRRVFDFPSPDISAAQRPQTTIPQQSLFFMNNPFTSRIAADVEEITRGKGAKNDNGLPAKIRRIYQQVLSRDPTPQDLKLGQQFIAKSPKWQQYIQALLMTNEFMFVD